MFYFQLRDMKLTYLSLTFNPNGAIVSSFNTPLWWRHFEKNVLAFVGKNGLTFKWYHSNQLLKYNLFMASEKKGFSGQSLGHFHSGGIINKHLNNIKHHLPPAWNSQFVQTRLLFKSNKRSYSVNLNSITFSTMIF